MKKNIKTGIAALLAVSALALTGCSSKDSAQADDVTTVTVGVVGEYNDHWETVNELLAPEKIHVELVKYSDYVAPNRALADGEIDLNSFQHKAFLANEVDTLGYDITAIGDTLIAPLALFNNKDRISSVADIKDGDIIAIPSDRTNGGRALKLLEAAGLIECDPAAGYVPAKTDITKYNVKIEILEAESSNLANLLPDCAGAIINGGNAFTAGLSPVSDSIFLEDVNPETNPAVSQLVNVIVCRTEDADNPIYKKVVDAFHTDAVRNTVAEAFQNAYICVW